MPWLVPGTLEAFGLYLIRTSALVLAAPLFGSGSRFSGYKVGLIGILATLMFLTGGGALAVPPDPLDFALMAMRELLIGLTLAFVLEGVLLAVRVAGELMGQAMAFTMASQVDPATGINTPLITRIYEGFFLISFLVVDGHHVVLRALDASFARAPIGAIPSGNGATALVQGLFGEMFEAGITFAAPILVILTLVSVLVGLLTRAVPQINVLEMSFSLRIVAAIVAMFFFAPLLEPALDHLHGALASGLEEALGALEG